MREVLQNRISQGLRQLLFIMTQNKIHKPKTNLQLTFPLDTIQKIIDFLCAKGKIKLLLTSGSLSK
jgi:hypothetical protein